MKPQSRLALRLALSFGLVFLLVAGTELALRIAKFRYPPAEFPILVWNKDEDRLMNQEDYLFAKDPNSLWTLRPGIRIQFGEREAIDGPPEYVNAAGYRGPLRPHAKPAGTLRVVTLGDSSTYGLGVHYEETYSAVLERELAARGIKAEVIVLGVDGYTIRQGIERYRHLGRRYQPDVVVAAFGAVNEHWAALDFDDDGKVEINQSQTRGPVAVARWVRAKVRIAQGVAYLVDPKKFKRVWKQGEEQRRMQLELAADQAEPDWTGKRRVSLQRFTELLGEFRREAEADGARLVVIAMPRRIEADEAIPVLRNYTRAALDYARTEKVQVLYALGRFRDLERNGRDGPELMIHDWWHPSPEGHRLIGEWLAPMIVDPAENLGYDFALPPK